MNSKIKKLFIATNTLLILKTVLNLIFLIMVIANISFVGWYIFRILWTNNIFIITYPILKKIIVAFAIYSAISIAVNVYLIFKNVGLVFKDNIYLMYNKKMIILNTILTFIFGGIVSGILFMLAFKNINKNLSNNNLNNLNIETINKLSNFNAHKLARINEFYDKGLLDEIQYQELVEKIIFSTDIENKNFDFDDYYNNLITDNNNNFTQNNESVSSNNNTNLSDINNAENNIEQHNSDEKFTSDENTIVKGYTDENGKFYTEEEVINFINDYESKLNGSTKKPTSSSSKPKSKTSPTKKQNTINKNPSTAKKENATKNNKSITTKSEDNSENKKTTSGKKNTTTAKKNSTTTRKNITE